MLGRSHTFCFVVLGVFLIDIKLDRNAAAAPRALRAACSCLLFFSFWWFFFNPYD